MADRDPEHPLADGCPPEWASEWGVDEFGLFVGFTVGEVDVRLRWIPRGEFMMGSPKSEVGRWNDEGPQHRVRITRGLWLGETPVTQALWQQVMGVNPSRFKGAKRPVEQVSWEDCQAFFERLNGQVNEFDARLPSEAEWEYACRATTHSARYSELYEVAWHSGNSDGETHAVGQLKPNQWGLYDMLGNVEEWCEDRWQKDAYANRGALTEDPLVTDMGGYRVFRGGSWDGDARYCRAASRSWYRPGGRGLDLGFRLARGQGRSPSQEGAAVRLVPPTEETESTKVRVERDGGGVIELVSGEKDQAIRAEPRPSGQPGPGFETGEDMYGTWLRLEVGGVSQRMRWIPPGEFLMGSPDDEDGRWVGEGPQHRVMIARGFWLGEMPVTQALWGQVMGTNPSRFKGVDRPVEQVSWEDCQAFLTRLNELGVGFGGRLPSEAEWEYACRAMTAGARYGELDEIAWHRGNSGEETHSVGQKQPNQWGLYDMLGNVEEWCADDWKPDAYVNRGARTVDPRVAGEGRGCVIRGGSWQGYARRCRAACRLWNRPSFRRFNLGVRLAGDAVRLGSPTEEHNRDQEPSLVFNSLPEKLRIADLKKGVAIYKEAAARKARRYGDGKVTAKLSISGATGRVTRVLIREPHNGTPLGEAVAAELAKARFPRFRVSSVGYKTSVWVPKLVTAIRAYDSTDAAVARAMERDSEAALGPGRTVDEWLTYSVEGLGETAERTAEYWNAGFTRIEESIRSEKTRIEERFQSRRIAVFGAAPTPLLIKLGFEIGGREPIDVFQFHAHSGSWCWDEEERGRLVLHRIQSSPEPSGFHVPNVAVFLSLTKQVARERDNPVPGVACDWYELQSREPEADIIRSRRELEDFTMILGSLLASIANAHPTPVRLHLFPEIPAAAAVECGRIISSGPMPEIVVYERTGREYAPVLGLRPARRGARAADVEAGGQKTKNPGTSRGSSWFLANSDST